MNDTEKTNHDGQDLGLILIGGRFAFLQAAMVIIAVIAYFIWPHVFAEHDIKKIYEGIQSHPFVYFMKLDPIVLIGTLFQLPVWFGLWAALRQYGKSVSLLALAIGLISIVAIFSTRPIIEIFSLSNSYAHAASNEMKALYIAAGEALFPAFHGTSWAVSIMGGGLAAILFSSLMAKSRVFKRATFWAMLTSGIGSLLVLIPVIGIVFLFFLGTIVGVIGSILSGIDLLRAHSLRAREIAKG